MSKRVSSGPTGEEAGLRDLLDAIDIPQVLLTPEGRVIAANAAAVEHLGVEAAQAAGRVIFDLLPPEVAAVRRSVFDEAVRTGAPRDFEDERDGRWFRHRIQPLADHAGAVSRVAVYTLEITETVRNDRALREREARYHRLYDAMTELFVLHELVRDEGGSIVDYRILECNQAFSAITGIPRETAVGALASRLYGTGAPPYLEIYAEVARSGQPARFEVYFAPMRKHFRIIAFPIEGGFATVADDVTEQKNAETALRQRESTFRQIAEAVPGVFWIRSITARKVSYVNPAYEKIFGRPSHDLLRRPESFLDLVHPDDVARVREAVGGLAAGRMFRDEYRIVRDDGAVRWIRARTFPIEDPQGQVDRVAGFAEDVTDLRHADEALRTIRALLETILERLSGSTGAGLFTAVAELLVEQVPGAHAIIGRLSEDGALLHLLAFRGPGGPRSSPREIPLAHTPCERTLRQQVGFYPNRLRRIFPEAPILGEIGAESYAGVALHGSAGQSLGIIAVLGGGAMEGGERERITFLLRLLALRASAELERLVSLEGAPAGGEASP
jgi:PAS domain S-box-containing protein